MSKPALLVGADSTSEVRLSIRDLQICLLVLQGESLQVLLFPVPVRGLGCLLDFIVEQASCVTGTGAEELRVSVE